jgi:hypothetical protein
LKPELRRYFWRQLLVCFTKFATIAVFVLVPFRVAGPLVSPQLP